MRIQFLTGRFAKVYPILLQIDNEVGDIVIDGFAGDPELCLTISVSSSEEPRERQGAFVPVRVIFERKSGTTGHAVAALYELTQPTGKKKRIRSSVQLVALQDGHVVLSQSDSIMLSPSPRA